MTRAETRRTNKETAKAQRSPGTTNAAVMLRECAASRVDPAIARRVTIIGRWFPGVFAPWRFKWRDNLRCRLSRRKKEPGRSLAPALPGYHLRRRGHAGVGEAAC